jgi:bacterial/archaeal transporter family protein
MSLPYLIILTILGWGVGSLFYKTANDNMHPIMVSAVVTIVYVILTPFSFLIKFDKTINTIGIVYSILGGLIMGLGSLAYFFALKKGEAGEITTVTALYPALTLGLSMLFLGEDLTWRKGVGILLALVSVLVLSWK